MNTKKLPQDLQAALIDMDGVLYDSMPYHAGAWYEMFKEFGLDMDPAEFYLYEGMTGDATIQMIIKRELGRDATEEEKKGLYARKAELFSGGGEKKRMPDADRMLRAFRKAGLKTVLVTGSAQGSLLDNLDEDYPGYFPRERMVTALDVENGKPHPEPYLRGLERAGATKAQAIVVENAPMGVRAGKAAGCFTIAVTTGPIPREEFEKEGADMIFPSMGAFADWLEDNLEPNPGRAIDRAVENLNPDKVVIVTDDNVREKVFPGLEDSRILAMSPIVSLIPGEEGKTIDSVMKIWEQLEESGATRKSLVVNIGGGMVTDTGGFAASTFKRGVNTINVPTTLLGAVDAATGGKTGVNYKGLKNEIGTFHQPSAVVISSKPLRTLSRREIMSGYAEMVKTGLIADKRLYIELTDVDKVTGDENLMDNCIRKCVEIKEAVVARDPREGGLRKILNFGHTAGHAFESLCMKKGQPVAHGEAVAHGMLVELILSSMIKSFPSMEVKMYADNILRRHYNRLPVGCGDIPELMELMAHDKKNRVYGEPDFTLLKEIGEPETGCHPALKDIESALEIYLSDAL